MKTLLQVLNGKTEILMMALNTAAAKYDEEARMLRSQYPNLADNYEKRAAEARELHNELHGVKAFGGVD
jgi:hypothetical protein